jgi:AcrR family transcriptional regulator
MSTTASRRVPQQERAERRVEQLLESAAEVMAENGYEAATMTEIAARAGASIGAVYQYFPNKEAIVRALRTKYGEEMEQCWDLLGTATDRPIEQLVNHLVDMMVQFTDSHPAYLPLLDAPVSYQRDQRARVRLRERFAEIFRQRKPSLQPEDAFRIANVALQIMKSMKLQYVVAKPRERQELVQEYKLALTLYLDSRLAL